MPAWLRVLPGWLSENLNLRQTIRDELDGLAADCPVLFTEHHVAHAASAFYPSPFDRAAILTVDGVGEWATTTISRGADDRIEMRLNGVSLDMEEAEVTDERALQMLAARPGEEAKYMSAPQVLSAHWFRVRLDKELLQHGWNTVEVVAHHLDPRAGFDRSVNGLEVLTRYKTWERPQGLQANEVNVKIR